MNPFHEQIRSVLQAIHIDSETTFTWLGKKVGRLPGTVGNQLSAGAVRQFLHYNVQSVLYHQFYCPGVPVSIHDDMDEQVSANASAFKGTLSFANKGQGTFEPGWMVVRTTGNYCIVEKEGFELWTHPGECAETGSGFPDSGTRISIRLPKELLNISPGFYTALSNVPMPPDDPHPVVRLYWNFRPDGVALFLDMVTTLLNEKELSFRLKVLNDPDLYERADSAVLYLSRNQYVQVIPIVEKVFRQCRSRLKEHVPAFTKKLARGLAVAEDPGNGKSFGMHCCGVLAEGLIRAFEQGQRGASPQTEVIFSCFREKGMDPDAPYLQQGSIESYDHPFDKSNDSAAVMVHHARPGSGENLTCLQTAEQIGMRLAKDAFWHGGRCNWMGFAPAKSTQKAVYSALGPELYTGTSGVALFLAQLYGLTANPEFRSTALGAMQQSLETLTAVSGHSRMGLHTGWAGIAFAAAQTGAILGEQGLVERAAGLAEQLRPAFREKHENDLIAGTAGGIAALLAMRERVADRAAILELASMLGDELLESADRSTFGFSWKTVFNPTRKNLTGFSHGTSGIGFALLELFSATGNAAYREAAEQAFAYEQHWFDAGTGNWPDFRKEPGQSTSVQVHRAFGTTWCHGAPGIVLSRLRAFELLEDQQYRVQAMEGLQATMLQTRAWLHSGTANFSLCHGLAGNAEPLLFASRLFSKGGPADSQPVPPVAYGQWEYLVEEIAAYGRAEFARPGRPWPCGAGNAETPGLMLGLAGIGYFYLRMHSPGVTSVLIPTAE